MMRILAFTRYSLLEFRIDAGDEILKNHHATCRATVKYSSKTIQNQFIALIGDHIRDSSIKEVKYLRLDFQENPKALCVHCNSHVLNLVIVKACSLPLVRNMAGTITECANFFNYSLKRLRCLEKVISLDQPKSQGTKTSDPCHTRWGGASRGA